MLIATMCLLQLLVGVILDRKYDRRLGWFYATAVFYPLLYWMFMAIVTVVSTPGGLLRRQRKEAPARWTPVREAG
jgi:biofilm PGA synthesis N-glycosyltransferase PgaC